MKVEQGTPGGALYLPVPGSMLLGGRSGLGSRSLGLMAGEVPSGPAAEGRPEEGGVKGSVCTPPAAEPGAPTWSASAGTARTAKAAARIRVLVMFLM